APASRDRMLAGALDAARWLGSRAGGACIRGRHAELAPRTSRGRARPRLIRCPPSPDLQSERRYAQLAQIIDRDRFLHPVGLAIRPPDQRAVVRVIRQNLFTDRPVAAEYIAERGATLELRTIREYRVELPLHVLADIDDDARPGRVLGVRRRVDDVV